MRRAQLVKAVLSSEPKTIVADNHTAVDWWHRHWASNVFTEEELQKRIPAAIFKQFKVSIKAHSTLTPDTANVVANAMKDWAIEHGATHFTHFFQPLQVSTAEKHESFINFTASGKTILVRAPSNR
jgi:glutamine synthetase type III